MKYLKINLLLLGLALLFTACQPGQKEKDTSEEKTAPRIVSLHGAVTEIISALGHNRELVGRDVTSNYPNYVRDSVKDLGHVSSLSMEALMQLNPSLILASETDMNEELKHKIKDSGADFMFFKQHYSIKGTKNLIKEVANFIGNKNYQPLIDKIDEDLKGVQSFEKKPKVLFVYARGAGTIMVAGKETPMAKIIEIAGGENAVDSFEGFKPLTSEAVVQSNPDIVLLFDTGLESLGGKKAILKAIPSLEETTAGKNEAIIGMDGALLSGFGPRVGEAAHQLNQDMAEYEK